MMPHHISAETVAHYRASGAWRDERLFDRVLAVAHEAPERIAVTGSGGTYTYGELVAETTALAKGLRRRGVKRGSVVAIQLPPTAEFVPSFLAVERLGGVVMPLVPSLNRRELALILALGRPTVAISMMAHGRHRPLEIVAQVSRGIFDEQPTLVVVGQDDPQGPAPEMIDWTTLATDEPEDLGPPPEADDLCELAFTSGTTGEPKGVLHTHNTSLSGIRSTITRQEIGPEDVVHVAIPVGHNFGYFYGVRLGLQAGATVVLQRRWDVDEMLDLSAVHGVTVSAGTPTHLLDLLDAEVRWGDRLATLRLFTCAGAPLSTSLARRAVTRLPGRLSRAFGMTELGHVTATGPEASPEILYSSEGSPQPEIELRVLDDDSRPLPVGEDGQIAFRGPFVFVGYVQGHDFSHKSFSDDGFFVTGDVGHVNRDGCLVLTGRAKEIIVRGGEKVPVGEIEHVLRDHPGVREIAIVGMPDRRLGERVVACVELEDDSELTLSDIRDFLEERGVTRAFWPESIEILDALPRSPSGKIAKRVVKEQMRENLEPYSHEIIGLEHVGIAVDDVGAALQTFEDLGFSQQWTEDLKDQGIRSHVLEAAGVRIELLESIREDSALAHFLKRYGAGLHHLCLQVRSLEGSLDDANIAGFQLTGRKPTVDQRGRRVFIHPRSAHGVLVGLVELHSEAQR